MIYWRNHGTKVVGVTHLLDWIRSPLHELEPRPETAQVAQEPETRQAMDLGKEHSNAVTPEDVLLYSGIVVLLSHHGRSFLMQDMRSGRDPQLDMC